MSELIIKKLPGKISDASDISLTFDKEGVGLNHLLHANWDEYTYKPYVGFRIAHDGQNIYINWQVNEKEIKAVCEKDGGNVWEDSCVEFFVSFKEVVYYNIECNCIGKILVCTGTEKNNRIPVASKETDSIKRWSSMGYVPVEAKSGKWELSLILPKGLFHLDHIETFDSLTAKGNFYKCGDNLETPHFLSWNPIESEVPNFHLPEYFGNLKFE